MYVDSTVIEEASGAPSPVQAGCSGPRAPAVRGRAPCACHSLCMRMCVRTFRLPHACVRALCCAGAILLASIKLDVVAVAWWVGARSTGCHKHNACREEGRAK